MDWGLGYDEAEETLAVADEVMASSAAVVVTLNWTVTTGGTEDRYGVNTGGTTTDETLADVRCLQSIVRPESVRMLEVGEFKVGDSIFYFDRDQDLEGKDELTIVDPLGNSWRPITDPPLAMREYVRTAILDTSVFQGVPARRTQ